MGTEETDPEIRTEIKRTDSNTVEEGETLATHIVKQGKRRIDQRVGVKNGSYAEACDIYYDGELLHETEELGEIVEWPSGRLNDDGKFVPMKGMQSDGEGGYEKEFGEPRDAVEEAVGIIKSDMRPETKLDEWWEDMKEQYDEDKF
jgi:hypothetical protein